MKKFLLTICMALPTLFVLGQSPGGVGTPVVWLKAEQGITTSGSLVNGWTNAGSSGGAAGQLGRTATTNWALPEYSANVHNFNPAVVDNSATNDGSLLLADIFPSIAHRALSSFVLYSNSNVAQENNMIAYTPLKQTSGALEAPFLGSSGANNLWFYWEGIYQTNPAFPNGIVRSNNIPSVNAFYVPQWVNATTAHKTSMSMNGATTVYPASGLVNAASRPFGNQLFIFGDGNNNNGNAGGKVSEIITYDRDLTPTEKQQINSYLSVKYGISLTTDDGTAVPNYLNSAGATVWNSTANSGYNNNIAGIANDAGSALNQKQSKSVNIGLEQVIVSTTGLADTNSANTTALTSGQYLIWGDNGLARTFSQNISGLPQVTARFAAVWKVQNTGSVGQVRIAWPRNNGLHVIISSDPTFASGNTATAMSNVQTINGIEYNYADVTIGNGQYFTFGKYLYAPGGIVPAAWYRADSPSGIYSDAGTTLAADNGQIQQWNEFNGMGTNISQATLANRPLYSNATTLTNFNPTVTFDGNNDILLYQPSTNGNINILDRSKGALFSAGNITGIATMLGFGPASDDPGLYSYSGTNNLLLYPRTGEYDAISTGATTGHYIGGGSWENGAGTAGNNAVLLSLRGNHQVFSTNIQNVLLDATRNDLRVGGDSDYARLDGQQNEVIIFPNKLTDDEVTKVESYLAVKYGQTLSSAQNRNYLSAAGTVVWDGTNNSIYYNNIAGIGREDISALHQKQSRSVNANQKLIIGAGNTLANTNALNTNSLTDSQFLIVGDNGLKQILSTPLVYTAGANGETNFRFESVWKAQNTGAVGNVIVAWPKGVANLYLVQSSDATFASGNTFTPMSAEVTVNGVVYNTATVTLGNGQFFTFAGYAHAPGGVAGPDFWIKSDDSGAIDTAWKDLSLNADDIPNVGGMTLSPADRNHNFHPYTTGYTSSKYFNNATSVMNPTTGTLNNISHSIFSAVRPSALGNGRITGIDNDANNAAEPGVSIAGGAPRHYEFTNTTTETDFATNFNVGVSNIFSAIANNSVANAGTSTFSGGEKVLGLNGTYATTTFTNTNRFQFVGRVLKVGYGTWNVSGAFPGDIMEVAWYKRPLSANEQSRVNSYLAVKNGVTLNENYLSTTSNVVWDRTVNTGYNNNIFGIAKDDVTALHQKQAGSVNPGQKLVISTTGFADSNVANNTGLVNNLQFLMTGDNGLKQALSIPLVYTAGSNGVTNYRFESVWKAQNTGTVGNVIVAWPKGISNLYLVQSADATFASGNTFTPMSAEVTVGGVVYNTATVTLGNGQFFTFAGYAHAPGGVINALSYWYRADKDAANTGVGTDVTTWTDFFSGNIIGQMGTNAFPKYVDGAANYFNFNPGVNFTAGTQTLGTVSVRTFSADSYDVFTFTKEGMASGGAYPSIFRSLVDNAFLTGGLRRWDGLAIQMNNDMERYSTNPTITDYGVFTPAGAFSTTIPSIMYNTFTATTTTRALNGAANFATTNHGGAGIRNLNGGHLFGDSQFGGNGSDNRGFIGHLGETIIYGAGNLSATERRRVDSYMAIKYGITLGRVGTDHYLGSTASATSIVWSGTLNAAYNNNIFGIARADIGGFEQKVSKSVNSGTILTIAKNNDFVSSNLAVSRTGLPVDEGYLLLGDNNNTSTVAYTPTEIGNCGEIIGATEQIKLIPRKWLVQRTNSVGGTYLQANLAAYTADLNTEIKMYIADDENFTQNVVAISGTQSGNNWVFPYNFDNDNTARYITFGGKFVAAPCEQCKGGTYTLRTGYQWNQGAWTNQTVNNKQNILLGNDADGNPLYASMYADYSANPSVEYVPTRYPQQYAGRWTIGRRYDNTNAQVQHRIELTKAMKASFQISNINTYRNNKNNFQVIGYCNGVPVMPKITYAYNTSYHTFNISGNQTIGTMSWRGFVPNVSTANVRFDRPVEQIVIICSVDRVNTDKTLRSILYSDITLECAEVVPPTPDNVYVSHSYTQETLATCGGNTTMRIKVTNNNICDNKTINLHQALPAGLVYVPGSFNGNDLPAGAMTAATLTYTGGNLDLSGLSLPSGEHWMYVDVANPGVVGTYPTQFTYEVANGVNPTNTYSSSVVNLNYYQSAAPVQSSPALTLSIKNNVTCGTNNMVMTYRMKIDNPNTTNITGAEILHMFDHNQVIQSVTYVTGEDEDGVITGTYPVDGTGTTIDPINNNLFNLIDAELPVGVSYIDVTVNTGNSYSIPDVQAQGISSTFLVGIGSGECAESGESVSNEVVLPMCTAVCYKPGIAATAGNPALPTKTGITSLNRAGAQDADNWPMVRNGGWLALESKTKGFVINRVAFTDADNNPATPEVPVGIPAANFTEGMMVYDTTNKCLKIFTSVNNGTSFEWHCMTTQTCPD